MAYTAQKPTYFHPLTPGVYQKEGHTFLNKPAALSTRFVEVC